MNAAWCAHVCVVLLLGLAGAAARAQSVGAQSVGAQPGGAQSERAQPERADSQHAQSEHAQSEHAQSEHAQSEHAQSDDGLFASRSHFGETTGAALYRSVCAGCHMADGRGAVGAGSYPSLVQDPRLDAAAYSLDVVLHGRGAMPPFQRLLSDRQVADVVGYIRQNFGNAYRDAPSADDVHAAR